MAEIDEMKLQEGLETDIAKARQMSQQSAQSQGVKPDEPRDFAPRAVRIKGRALAQRELANSGRTFDTAITDLLAETNITDTVEQDKFKSQMKSKLNHAQMQLIKMSQKARKELERMNLDQAKKEAMWKAIRGAVKNSATALMMGGGNGGVPDAPTPGMQDPGLTDISNLK